MFLGEKNMRFLLVGKARVLLHRISSMHNNIFRLLGMV
jgi:hypothetical protein